MENYERNRLEAMLAEDVCSYLRVCERRDEIEQEQLRSLCETLARLLGGLLEEHEQWSRYYWVDAIVPTATTARSGSELNVEGFMIWAERGQSGEWMEPFSASIRLREPGREMSGYRITCGDAVRGLRTLNYTMGTKRARWARAEGWLFEFSTEIDQKERAQRAEEATAISELVQRELQRITDARLADRIRELLITPYPVQRAWDYGAPDTHFTCWTVLEHRPSNTGIAFCSEGFGPSYPWGLVSVSGTHMGIGMDCSWFVSLEDAMRNSMAWDGENPEGYEVH
jgi:hypothetical protein